jgi:NADH-quinone oxidoreductase subunit L
MTHAFFKALLFLAAGVVIHASGDEHDIFRLGGLRHRLPGTSLAFLIGAASLAAVPLVTAGFYSKDLIIWYAYASPSGGWLPWLAAELGSFLTGLYIFRVIFVAFAGPPGAKSGAAPPTGHGSCLPESIALAVLSVLALVGGFVELPHSFGDFQPFSERMHAVLPPAEVRDGLAMSESSAMIVTAAVALAGIALAWLRYGRRRAPPGKQPEAARQPAAGLWRYWQAGWGFDWLYDRALVRPFLALTHANRRDVIDSVYTGVARAATGLHRLLGATQTGRLRWYAAGIAAGAVVLLGILVLP